MGKQTGEDKGFAESLQQAVSGGKPVVTGSTKSKQTKVVPVNDFAASMQEAVEKKNDGTEGGGEPAKNGTTPTSPSKSTSASLQSQPPAEIPIEQPTQTPTPVAEVIAPVAGPEPKAAAATPSKPAPKEVPIIETVPAADPIAAALETGKLADSPIAPPTPTGGTGGAGVDPRAFVAAQKANEEQQKRAKEISDQVAAAGYDAKELYSEFKDFPQKAFESKVWGKEQLLQLRKDNPVEYRIRLNNTKNQYQILEGAYKSELNALPENTPNKEAVARANAVHIANTYNSLNAVSTLKELYPAVKTQKDIINANLEGSDRTKAIQRIHQSIIPVLNAANPELLEEYGASPLKEIVTPTQFAALKVKQLLYPESYSAAVAALENKKPAGYELKSGFDPFTGKSWVKEEETEPSVDREKGLQIVKKQLADEGRFGLVEYAQRQIFNIKKQIEAAPEDQRPALAARLQQFASLIDGAEADAKKDDQRYPLVAELKYDDQVKELTQKAGMNPLEYAVYRFGKGMMKPLNSIENLSTAAFGSDEDNAALQLQRLGESATEQSQSYLPENMRVQNSPVVVTFKKELQSQRDKILQDESLSDEQKDEKLKTLVKTNQDKVDYITNPEAGKTKNFFSSATLYANAGMIGDITAFALQSAGLNALAAPAVVANTAPLFLGAQDDFYKEAIANGSPNPTEYATTHALILAAAGLINPKLDIVKRVMGAETAAGKIIAGLDEKTWQSVIEKKSGVVDKFLNSAAAVGKEAGKMAAVWGAGVPIAKDIVDKYHFGKDVSGEQILENAATSVKHTLISSLALFGVEAFTHFKSVSPQQKATLWQIASTPETTRAEIKEAVRKGDVTQEVANKQLQVVNELQKTLERLPVRTRDGKLLSDKDRLDLLYEGYLSDKGVEVKKDTPEAKEAPADTFGYKEKIAAAKTEEEKVKIDKEYAGFLSQQSAPFKQPTNADIVNDVKNKRFTTVEFGSESEVPDVWKDKVSSTGTINGKKTVRVTLPTSQYEYDISANKETAALGKPFSRGTLLEEAKGAVANADIKGYTAEIIKDAAENDPKALDGYLKNIAERAQDPMSRENTIGIYGKELVDIAEQLHPKINDDGTQQKAGTPGTEAQENTATGPSGSENERTNQSRPEEVITVGELVDKPILYKGERASIYQDGQTLIAKIEGKNKEYEIGNVDEVGKHSIKDYGIEQESSVVGADENGDVTVRGEAYKNNYSDPLAAINYDKEGNVLSVNLETADGKKRTFRGNVAEDVAYQIHLKEITKDNAKREAFETFINEDPATVEAFNARESKIAPEGGTVEANAPVSREPAERKQAAEVTGDESLSEVDGVPSEYGKVGVSQDASGKYYPFYEVAAKKDGYTQKISGNLGGPFDSYAEARSHGEAAMREKYEKDNEGSQAKQQPLIEGAEKPNNENTKPTEKEAVAEKPQVREQEYTTKTGKYTVKYEDGKRVVYDKEGNVLPEYVKVPATKGVLADKDGNKRMVEIKNKVRDNVLREHDRSYNYNFGEKANTENLPPEIQTDKEAYTWIVENSKNPSEVAQIYMGVPREGAELSEVENAIAEYGIGKISTDSFNRFGDRNNITDTLAKTHLRKDGAKIDTLAEEISAHTGKEVTPQDIVDYLVRFPAGDAEAKRLGEVHNAAAERFEQLTGIPLNDRVAEQAVKQLVDSAELEQATKEYAEENEPHPEADWDTINREQSENEYNEQADNADEFIPNPKVDASAGAEKSEVVDGDSKIPGSEMAGDTGSASGERGAETPSESGGNEPPAEAVPKPVTAAEGDFARLTHADSDEIRARVGLEERTPTERKKNAETIEQAKNLIDSGADFTKIASRVMSGGGTLSDPEQVAFAIVVKGLQEKQSKLDILSPEFKELQSQIQHLNQAAEISGTVLGRGLQARQIIVPFDDTISGAVTRMTEAYGRPMTDAEALDIQAKHKAYEQEKHEDEAAQVKMAKLQIEEQSKAEIERLQKELAAQKAVNDKLAEKAGKVKGEKKDKETVKKEREDIRQSIKDKWKNAGNDGTLTAVPIPYASQLMAIAPDVAKLVKSYVEEGVTKLSEVVERVYNDLKGDIPDIDKSDVVALIGGAYNKPKETRNELAAKMRDLKDQAALTYKLERLESQPEPKEPKAKIKRTQEIEALREQIKDHGVTKLSEVRKRNLDAAKKIEKRIADKDFAPPKPKSPMDDPELRKKHPEEYKQALEAQRKRQDAIHELDIAARKAELEKQSRWEKIRGTAGKTLRTFKALKAGIDFSATVVQNGLAILANPALGAKSLLQSFSALLSNARLDRQLAEIHNSDFFDLMVQSGLSVVEPKSLKATERDEFFADTFFDNLKKKIGGKTYDFAFTKPFERQFTSLGNSMRVHLFMRRAAQLLEQGYTFESHPKEFKDAATVVNTMTGRGNLADPLKKHNEVLTTLLWSPRLLASSLNVIGAGELAWVMGGKSRGYYTGLTSKQAKFALSQTVRGIGTGIAIMAALKYFNDDSDADIDPRSSGFGNVKIGDYSYNIFGRYTSLARSFTQLALREKVVNDEAKNMTPFQTSRTAIQLIRGKLNPTVGTGWTMVTGQDYNGKPVDCKKELIDMFTPLTISDVRDGVNSNEGLGLIRRTLLTAAGVKITPTQKK